MKLFFTLGLMLIFSFTLHSENRMVKITKSNGEIELVPISEIKDIRVEKGENPPIWRNHISESNFDINTDSLQYVGFDNGEIYFETIGFMTMRDIADIDSITFVPNIKTDPQPVTIKELELDEVLLSGLTNPWGMAFVNENYVLITERPGRLIRYMIDSKESMQISGLPEISATGQGGLLDVVLHPNFEENRYVYLSYSVAAQGGTTTAVGRGLLQGNQLTNFEEIFRALPILNSGQHFGSRIAFDKENYLYISVGDRGNQNLAQRKDAHAGKVMRIFDDGRVPEDNPFYNEAGALKEIWSWGHRNIQGMRMNPRTGDIWAHEHGPRGGDELNKIIKGENYGWPLVTHGVNYNGTPITGDTTLPGYVDPILHWTPSIAPCGMTFVKHGNDSDEDDIILGALAGQHLSRLKLEGGKVVQEIKSLMWYSRFRDVAQAPDGKLYSLTESPGRLIRLKEKE